METIDQSKFNMGLAILQRIDIILNSIAEHSLDNDLNKWSEATFALYNEIRFLMNKNEREEYDLMFSVINRLRSQYNNAKDKTDLYGELYFALMNFGTFLRVFLNSKNMLLAKSADASKAIIET